MQCITWTRWRQIKAEGGETDCRVCLDELREARSMTQAGLADILGKDQSVISRIEKRADMYVSTLAEFIRAMGRELEIRAVFPEGSVRIRRFGDIAG